MDKEILIQAGEWQVYQKKGVITGNLHYFVVRPLYWDICVYRERDAVLLYPAKRSLYFNCLEILKQTNAPREIKMFIETLILLNEL